MAQDVLADLEIVQEEVTEGTRDIDRNTDDFRDATVDVVVGTKCSTCRFRVVIGAAVVAAMGSALALLLSTC